MTTELAFLSTKVKDLETLAKEMLDYIPPTGNYRTFKERLEAIGDKTFHLVNSTKEMINVRS